LREKEDFKTKMRNKVNSWLQQLEKQDNFATLLPLSNSPIMSHKSEILSKKSAIFISKDDSLMKEPKLMNQNQDELYDSISKRTGEDASHFMSGFFEVLGISALQANADRTPNAEESKDEFGTFGAGLVERKARPFNIIEELGEEHEYMIDFKKQFK
jgi:hypothetical protein